MSELDFSGIVQLIRKETGLPYEKAARVLDKAIQPQIIEGKIIELIDLLSGIDPTATPLSQKILNRLNKLTKDKE